MKELFFLIILVLGVAIGFAGCGDDDETTDAPVESSVDAGGEVADAGAGGEDAAGSDAAAQADDRAHPAGVGRGPARAALGRRRPRVHD